MDLTAIAESTTTFVVKCRQAPALPAADQLLSEKLFTVQPGQRFALAER